MPEQNAVDGSNEELDVGDTVGVKVGETDGTADGGEPIPTAAGARGAL